MLGGTKVKNYTKRARIEQLMAMHELMLNANDEEIYMRWVTTGVPDCPDEGDFEYIAENDEAYHYCFDLFVRLVADRDIRW